MLETKPAKVLLGVGDEDVEGALAYAVAEAERRGVGVHLLHVVPGVAVGSVGIEPSMMVIEGDALRDRGSQILEEVADRIEHELGELPVSTELHAGPVVPAITGTSRNAAVVVLQRQRMGRPGRIPTLSVTNAVAAHSDVPVVAVPADWHPDPDRDRSVVVGLGDVAFSVQVVRTGLEEARRRGGRVRFVHAWHHADSYDDVILAGSATAAYDDRVREELESALAPLQAEFPDVPTELVSLRTRPADLLVAESATACVLVLGRHRSSMPWGPHLGSVVRAVLRESSCPVVVVDPIPATSS
jgi:nucleotide-binding universal stress UspA family protein